MTLKYPNVCSGSCGVQPQSPGVPWPAAPENLVLCSRDKLMEWESSGNQQCTAEGVEDAGTGCLVRLHFVWKRGTKKKTNKKQTKQPTHCVVE